MIARDFGWCRRLEAMAFLGWVRHDGLAPSASVARLRSRVGAYGLSGSRQATMLHGMFADVMREGKP